MAAGLRGAPGEFGSDDEGDAARGEDSYSDGGGNGSSDGDEGGGGGRKRRRRNGGERDAGLAQVPGWICRPSDASVCHQCVTSVSPVCHLRIGRLNRYYA